MTKGSPFKYIKTSLEIIVRPHAFLNREYTALAAMRSGYRLNRHARAAGKRHAVLQIIRLAVMLYVRFPLSLRNVEDLLHEQGSDVSHETIRF